MSTNYAIITKFFTYFYENHREIEKVIYYNSTENQTQLKKRRYTRKTQLTSVKESIIPFIFFHQKVIANLMNFSFVHPLL
jgi:hypothetical protein